MKHTKKSTLQILKIGFGLLSILMISACGSLTPTTATTSPTVVTEPPATPLPVECKPIRVANSAGLALVTFNDGSQVFLGPDTEFDFILLGSCDGADSHLVTLLKGEIAIRSLLPLTNPFTINSLAGFEATISDTGLIRYEAGTGVFQVNCTNGECTIGTSIQSYAMVCGQAAEVNLDGKLTRLDGIDLEVLEPYGDWLLPKCDQVPTEVPTDETPTPDVGATATAVCSEWLNQFPLTPCPTNIVP